LSTGDETLQVSEAQGAWFAVITRERFDELNELAEC
jgi:hypothetical protein